MVNFALHFGWRNAHNGNSEGGHGATISGGYWGLLGALTAFAYWGAREGMQNAECKMQNAKCKMQNAKPTLRSESRGQTCLRYAEPRGGKACEAGLTDAAEREQRANLYALSPLLAVTSPLISTHSSLLTPHSSLKEMRGSLPRIFLVDQFVLFAAKARQTDAIAITPLGYNDIDIKFWFQILFHSCSVYGLFG